MSCTYTYKNKVYHSYDDLVKALLFEKEARVPNVVPDRPSGLSGTNLGNTVLPKKKDANPVDTDAILYTLSLGRIKNKVINTRFVDGSVVPLNSTIVISTKENPLFKMYAVKTNGSYVLYSENGLNIMNTGISSISELTKALRKIARDLSKAADASKLAIGYYQSTIQDSIINKIEQSSANMVLDNVLNKYVNKETGQEFERVSNVIKGRSVTENEEDNPFTYPAVKFGNLTDAILRDSMNGSLRTLEEYNSDINFEGFKLSEKAYKELIAMAGDLKIEVEKRGEKIVTNNGNDIILSDPETGVAGAVDLMTVDILGNIRIYDYKTMRGNKLKDSYKGETVSKWNSTKYSEISALEHYTKQQSYYKAMVEKITGKEVTRLSLIPLQIPMYAPTDRVILTYTNHAPIVLDAVDVSLSKVKPDVILPDFKDFFLTFSMTPAIQSETEAWLNDYMAANAITKMDTVLVPDEDNEGYDKELLGEDGKPVLKEYISYPPIVTNSLKKGQTVDFEIIDGVDYVLISSNGVTKKGKIEQIYKHLAANLAYEKLKEESEIQVVNNSVNTVVSHTPVVPDTEDDIDAFFAGELTGLTSNVNNPTDTPPFIGNYAKNGQIAGNNLKQFIIDAAASAVNPAQKELWRILAANPDAFNSIPVVFDESLGSKGSVSTTAEGDIKAVYINPTKIKTVASFRATMAEELTHVLTIKAIRNNKQHMKAISEFRILALDMFGEVRMANAKLKREEIEMYKRKERIEGSLSPEEQAIYDELIEDEDVTIAYRLENDQEFIAGVVLSNSLKKFLNNIDTSDPLVQQRKNLWTSIIDFIYEVFNSLMNGKANPILKHSLYHTLSAIEKSAQYYHSNPDMLSVAGMHRSSIVNLEQKFNLRGENGSLNMITNGQEVEDFINTNVANVIATHNEDGTITLRYTRNTAGFNAADSVYNDMYEGDTEDGVFKEKIKSYIVNLNQRQKAIGIQLRNEPDTSDMSDDEYKAFILKREKLSQEYENLKAFKKNIALKGDVTIQSLSDLAEQGLVELNNIETYMNGDMSEVDITYSLQTIKFWVDAKKFLFNEQDYSNSGLVNTYNEVEARAKVAESQIVSTLENWVMDNMVNKYTSNTKSLEGINQSQKDIGQFSGLLSDISTANSPILQAVGKYTKLKDIEFSKVRVDRLNRFNSVLKSAKSSLNHYSNGKEKYEIFRQMDALGNPTRNMVNRFSAKYMQERYENLNFVYTNGDKTSSQMTNGFHFMLENDELPNLNVLFNDTLDPVAYNEEVERLQGLLGTNHTSEYLAEQASKIKSYKRAKQGHIIVLKEKYGYETDEEVSANTQSSKDLEVWEALNSPFILMNNLIATKENSSNAPDYNLPFGYNVFKYISNIPKKNYVSEDGERITPNNYDSKFEIIERDEALLALYKEFQDISKYVNDIMPYDSPERLAHGRIPEFKKEMFDIFKGDFKKGLQGVQDALVDAIRTEKYDTTSEDIDIVTGRAPRDIRLGINKTDEKINDEMNLLQFESIRDTGLGLSEGEYERKRSEIVAKYAEEMEFDLGKVYDMYLQLGTAYEYKSEMETGLNLTQIMFENQQEYERDNKGQLKEDASIVNYFAYKKKNPEVSYVNYKKILDNTIGNIIYGDRREINSTKNKIYTPAEKKIKLRLEKEIEAMQDNKNFSSEQRETFEASLQKQIDKLGAYGDTEKFIDMPLKYVQYLGMGWNVMGGISNMIFGYIANTIEGAGNEHYSSAELMSAYRRVVGNSSLRNASFNMVGTDEALKIRALMDNYDIMAEGAKEYENLVGSDITSKLKVASAFNINQRTEYINQAPIMLAMMEKVKFEHNGKEFPLYKGFNIDGTWNEDLYGEYPADKINDTVLKIKALIQRNHGNYNPLSPMLVKRHGIGRLFMQFRTWMVEGVRMRWGYRDGEKDEILGTVRKGRYWSLIDTMKSSKGGATKAIVGQMLLNFIPFKSKLGIKSNPIDGYFKDRKTPSPADVANLKRVALELNMLLGVYAVGIVMRMMLKDLDDDDWKKRFGFFTLNQITRARTDVMMYVNLNEATKLLQDPIPALRIFSNAASVIDAADKTLQGKPDYENGIYEGHNRMIKAIFAQIPFLSQAYKNISNTSQDFGSK